LAEILFDFRSSSDDFLEVLRTFFPRGPTPDSEASDVPFAYYWGFFNREFSLGSFNGNRSWILTTPWLFFLRRFLLLITGNQKSFQY
jgi:hypothetical protein